MANRSNQKSEIPDNTISQSTTGSSATPTTQAESNNNSHQLPIETTCLTLQPPTPASLTESSVPQLADLESGCTTDILPQIQNVVSTFNVTCLLDLYSIANKARNSEYNPKRFAALIMRVRSPKTTALIFSSGKVVCTGAKSLEDSRLASRKYARIIQKLGYPAKFTQFQIQNIVGSCDVKFRIRLEGLVLAHRRFCSYEPELFPGLIYRMVQPKVVLLIFVSGKIVLTGAKVKEDIDEAFKIIYPNLRLFMKSSTSVDDKDSEKSKE